MISAQNIVKTSAVQVARGVSSKFPVAGGSRIVLTPKKHLSTSPMPAQKYFDSSAVQVPAAGKCPITGLQVPSWTKPDASEPSSTTNPAEVIPFEKIPGPPIYPLIGSIRDFMSRNPPPSVKVFNEYYYEFGPIVKHNLIGPEVIIYHPEEYLKVFRADMESPFGAAADTWPLTKYFDEIGQRPGLLTQGPEWKEARQVLQADIVSPQAASSYLPYINTVTRRASEVLPEYLHDLETFSSRAAFDMFTQAILGKTKGTLFPDADPKDVEYAHNAKEALTFLGLLNISPIENIKVRKLGIKTENWRKFCEAFTLTNARGLEVAQQTVREIQQEEAAFAAAAMKSSAATTISESTTTTTVDAVSAAVGGIEDAERLWEGVGVQDVTRTDSYLKRLLSRGNISPEAAGAEVAMLLSAAVDTTSNFTNWLLWNLARFPDKQEALARELQEKLKGEDYKKEVKLPYLRAFYRETFRFSPITSATTYRILKKDIVLNGANVPAGTRLLFAPYPIQHDPRIVKHPDSFLPERWLDEAVASRKGTPEEIIDHKLLATPFSFGPRMCLGGRLAEAEMFSLVTRIVQDWEIGIAEDCPDIGTTEKLLVMLDGNPKFTLKSRR